MYKDFTTRIDPAECLTTSRVILNSNFNSLYTGCRDVNEVITLTEDTGVDILQRANTVVKNINSLLSSEIYNARLTLSPTDSNSTENIESTNIYIHPYGGNTIALYNLKYDSWLTYSLQAPKSFALKDQENNALTANTNYDIFLSYLDDFTVTFIKWGDESLLQFNEGVCVQKGDVTKRYIGCLRTTKKGTTEVKYTVTSTHGDRLKSFLWNYKNQTTKQVKNILTVEYGLTNFNSWVRTSVENEETETENGCRLDFIVGDTSMLDFEYQSFFECKNKATVSAGMSINSVEYIQSRYNTVCRVFPVNIKGWGTATAQLHGNVPRGFHFLQTFDRSNTEVSFNIVYNNVYKTGFTGIITN